MSSGPSPASATASRTTLTSSDSTSSPSCLPNGVWLQPIMHAVMTGSSSMRGGPWPSPLRGPSRPAGADQTTRPSISLAHAADPQAARDTFSRGAADHPPGAMRDRSPARRDASNRPSMPRDVGVAQDGGLELQLVQPMLHRIPDADQAREPAAFEHGQVPYPVPRHQAEHAGQAVLRATRDDVAGHDVADPDLGRFG